MADRKPPWSDAERTAAAKLRAEGYSAAYIADVLGRTRNAVIAELWRMEARPPENVRPHCKGDPRRVVPPPARSCGLPIPAHKLARRRRPPSRLSPKPL